MRPSEEFPDAGLYDVGLTSGGSSSTWYHDV